MSENRPQQTGVENLLQQDVVVSSFPYEEFRMKLEDSIKRLEKQAETVHRWALCSLGVFLVCVVTSPLLTMSGQIWMLRIWMGCGVIALFVTGVLAAIDFYKYRPALKRKQRDALWAAIDQLQHDVAELRGQLQEGP